MVRYGLQKKRILWQCSMKSKRSSFLLTDKDKGRGREEKHLTRKPLDRRRAELWKPLAEELGVTWQSVDAMHWALGREEMARRADRLNPHSEQSLSSKGTAKKQTDFTDDSTGTLHFGGYRVHHFNATRPPRVQLPNPVAPQPIEATAGQATISNVDPDCSASSDRGKNGDMNLAAEGRRQVSPELYYRSRYRAVNSLLANVDQSCR